MEEIKNIIQSDKVTVLNANKNCLGNHEKIDKGQLCTKLDSQKRMEFIQNQLKGKNFNERCEFIKSFKTLADELYHKRQFEEASKKYLEALMGLSMNKKLEEEYKIMLNDYQIPILLNLSTVYIESKEYNKSLGILSELEKIKETFNNPKLYYKYAIWYERLDKLELSLENINKSYNLEPTNEKYLNKKTSIEKKVKINLNREKTLYERLKKYKVPENINIPNIDKKKELESISIVNFFTFKTILDILILYFILIKEFISRIFLSNNLHKKYQ